MKCFYFFLSALVFISLETSRTSGQINIYNNGEIGHQETIAIGHAPEVNVYNPANQGTTYKKVTIDNSGSTPAKVTITPNRPQSTITEHHGPGYKKVTIVNSNPSNINNRQQPAEPQGRPYKETVVYNYDSNPARNPSERQPQVVQTSYSYNPTTGRPQVQTHINYDPQTSSVVYETKHQGRPYEKVTVVNE